MVGKSTECDQMSKNSTCSKKIKALANSGGVNIFYDIGQLFIFETAEYQKLIRPSGHIEIVFMDSPKVFILHGKTM